VATANPTTETNPPPAPPADDQYDVGDSAFDPVLDGEYPAAAAPRARPAEPPAPPRGPDGRFAPADRPKVPARLAAKAAELGFSEQEIADTPAAELSALVNLTILERLGQRPEPAPPAPPAAPARKPGNAPAAAGNEPAPADEEVALGIDEEKYDPDLLGVIKAQAKELKALKALVGQIHGDLQAGARRTATQQCDAAFARHPELFGTATFEEIDKTSAEFVRRNAAIDLVRKMNGPGTLAQKVDRAVEILFGARAGGDHAPARAPAQAPTSASEEQRRRESEWNGAGLARPTYRRADPEPKGDRRAMKAVARKLSERGVTDADFDALEENGLPD